MVMSHYKKSISSGILTASARIFEEEGWLNGAILTGGSTDATVTFYDSADEDLGDALVIGFISQAVPLFDFAVHCKYGIYAEVAEGAEYLTLYDK
ncbi:unnamed protein product, partial [marine sediment metagenome]